MISCGPFMVKHLLLVLTFHNYTILLKKQCHCLKQSNSKRFNRKREIKILKEHKR
jgi:hypothetical protein